MMLFVYTLVAWAALTGMYVAACLLDSRGEWRGGDPTRDGVALAPHSGQAPVSQAPHPPPAASQSSSDSSNLS